MSKLGIILCATAFFASGTFRDGSQSEEHDVVYSADLAVLNREIAHRHIEQAIEKVKERSTEMYDRVMQLGPRNGEEKMHLTLPYIQRVTDHLDTMLSFVNHYIETGNPRRPDATNCKSYYLDYESVVKNHMSGLARLVSYEVYHEATMWIGELLHEVNNKTRTIRNLQARANTCDQFECNDVSKDARDICDSYFTETADALEYYQKMSNGSMIIEKLNHSWHYYLDLGQEVLQTIYDCVFNS